LTLALIKKTLRKFLHTRRSDNSALETKCIAKGDPYCEFLVKKNDHSIGALSESKEKGGKMKKSVGATPKWLTVERMRSYCYKTWQDQPAIAEKITLEDL
jgi:hypothetical protein